MVRAVLCVGMLAGALNALSESLRNINWYMIARTVENDQVGPAIEAFLGAIHDPTAAIAGVLLLLSIILLAWPPRRIDHVQSSPANEGA